MVPKALMPWNVEIARKANRIIWPKARTISKLLDRMYVINESIDDQLEAKNSADASNANKGRIIRIFLFSTEKRRFRSPMYTMIPKNNNKPTVSRITSINEGMPKLKPTNDELKGQKIITLSIKRSPKAKCCTTATK